MQHDNVAEGLADAHCNHCRCLDEEPLCAPHEQPNLGTFGAWLVTGRSCRQSSASETRSDNGRTMLAKVALIRKWLLISSTKCKSWTVVSILPQRCGGVNDILCGLMMGCSLQFEIIREDVIDTPFADIETI